MFCRRASASRAARNRRRDAAATGVGLEAFADFGHEGFLVGKFAGGELGVEQFVSQGHFEAAARRRLQLQPRDALLVLRKNLGRQTDGRRLVASRGAVP